MSKTSSDHEKYLKRSFLFQKNLMDKNLKYLCVSAGVEMKSTIFSYPLSYHQAIADISESNKTNISERPLSRAEPCSSERVTVTRVSESSISVCVFFFSSSCPTYSLSYFRLTDLVGLILRLLIGTSNFFSMITRKDSKQ